MRIIHSLSKPEFVFRPSQIFRRLAFAAKPPTSTTNIQLPWGHWIAVNPSETVGSCIARQGVYDISGCESIWRLLDNGDSALDVGANVGQMTSLMAAKVGSKGQITSFEPHPNIHRMLARNCDNWRDISTCASIDIHSLALSNKVGTFKLFMPPKFEGNNGVASLENEDPQLSTFCDVSVCTLDKMFPNSEKFGLMKIDIEGHELSALEGGINMLSQARIRDIIFEEHNPLPTAVSEFLSELGFKLFYIHSTLWGPHIVDIDLPYKVKQFDAPNYLATRDPVRAISAFEAPGWKCIRAR